MDAFKFDTILSSLHDLQHAKSVNEVKLGEESSHRKQLESLVQKATTDLRSVTIKHSNLLQASHVTEHKVTQLENQIKTLEQLNHDKSNKIDEMNKKILNEQEKQQKDLFEFENTMSELSDRFRTAPNTFSDSNLDCNIKEFQQEICKLQLKVSKMKEHISRLSSEVVKRTSSQFVELEEKQTSLVYDIFTEEYKMSKEKKKKMEEKEIQLKEQSSKLDQESEKLKQELEELNKQCD